MGCVSIERERARGPPLPCCRRGRGGTSCCLLRSRSNAWSFGPRAGGFIRTRQRGDEFVVNTFILAHVLCECGVELGCEGLGRMGRMGRMGVGWLGFGWWDRFFLAPHRKEKGGYAAVV